MNLIDLKQVAVNEAKTRDVESIQQLVLLCFTHEHENQFDTRIDLSWPLSKACKKDLEEHITDDDCVLLVAALGDEIVGYLLISPK